MDIFPVEIIQDILGYLKPVIRPSPANETATLAEGRQYITIGNWWSKQIPTSITETQRELARIRRNGPTEQLPFHYSKKRDRRYAALLPLRLVNRVFCEICTSYVYQELNIHDTVENNTYDIATRYGQHVRRIRIYLTEDDIGEDMASYLTNAAHRQRILDVITLCPDVQILGIYNLRNLFRGTPGTVSARILHLLGSMSRFKDLSSIGIYFPQNRSAWPVQQIVETERQLTELIFSERVQALKRLDLSIPSISRETQTLLRTHLPQVEYLSLYGNLRPVLHSVRGGLDSLDWSGCTHLTHLRLTGKSLVTWIYSAQLPQLVRNCPSLQYLHTTDLGTVNDERADVRAAGWSFKKDEWWNQRKPLRYLHIEAAMNATIYFLAIIPVEEATIVNYGNISTVDPFMTDEEGFPHINTLHVRHSDPNINLEVMQDAEWHRHLRTVCEGRGINLDWEQPPTVFGL
ncbi:hypothetical protein CPB86DRAFT_869242 [Serendipita vermifera]|nr:hypothetical protein CPB86DRAFT_869242 [Serendipita vermifera]